MKHTFLMLCATCVATVATFANAPDSVYLKVLNNNGLHFAWSADGAAWNAVGDGYIFLKSDYGRWGSGKKMIAPALSQKDGKWRCEFFVTEEKNVIGYATSDDLIHWTPQDYKQAENLTADEGGVFKLPFRVVQNLTDFVALTAAKNRRYNETTKDDALRFANLQQATATLEIFPDKTLKISDKLIGVFFEDISYAADGGLYAELVQNRDFEYSPKDRKEWHPTTAWRVEGGAAKIETDRPLSQNNPHYLVLKNGQSIVNEGFDGIAVAAGEKYDFSFFARNAVRKSNPKISVYLIDNQGNVTDKKLLHITSSDWKKYSATLTATKTVKDARLYVGFADAVSAAPSEAHAVDLDMISLFPQKTFHHRKNGLRADLAQTIADLRPRFVRFPGGCVAHGDGLENIYRWKNTIGNLENRKPDFNIWGYHQTFGLGYYEYFQFCEDIGAEPLPVLAAGVPCQNSSPSPALPKGAGVVALAGQQGGIPMNEMDGYVQDILDLIEWANGDAKTTKWGKIRAAAGHPAPFNLKYIGIGNEDLISDVFKERFEMIYNAIRKKHPEITVIGTVGPFFEGSDYEEGWRFASALNVPMVDEHYYVAPGWMIHNQDYYDRYDRSKPKVYLGEYAAHLPGRPNNVETALAEALYLCNVERNADVVTMTSYAPLLAKDGHTNWNPDLIYFNNTEIRPTVGYYVQQVFGQNAGDEYIASELTVASRNDDLRRRIAVSIVKDNKSGDYILKMVNLLPVETSVQISGFVEIKNPGAIQKTVLTGAPADKNACPVTTTVDLQDGEILLPAYSLVVLRGK